MPDLGTGFTLFPHPAVCSQNIYLNRFVLLCLLVICSTKELRPREYDSDFLAVKFNLSTTPERKFYMPASWALSALLCVTYTPLTQPPVGPSSFFKDHQKSLLPVSEAFCGHSVLQ